MKSQFVPSLYLLAFSGKSSAEAPPMLSLSAPTSSEIRGAENCITVGLHDRANLLSIQYQRFALFSTRIEVPGETSALIIEVCSFGSNAVV